ncbi:MAG TPA: hypothetical protein VNP98_02655 [Chthoniobacterales bacterium]|nr:hypothetical protein [Chthoniobacterales bacterium]
MTSNQKFSYGLTLEIVGAFLFVIGVAISFTLIGACLGIPMALAGLPLMIWGIVWLFQAKAEKTKEIITVGIQQGLAQREFPQTMIGPPPNIAATPIRQAAAPPPIPPALLDELRPVNKQDNGVSSDVVDSNDEPEQRI